MTRAIQFFELNTDTSSFLNHSDFSQERSSSSLESRHLSQKTDQLFCQRVHLYKDALSNKSLYSLVKPTHHEVVEVCKKLFISSVEDKSDITEQQKTFFAQLTQTQQNELVQILKMIYQKKNPESVSANYLSFFQFDKISKIQAIIAFVNLKYSFKQELAYPSDLVIEMELFPQFPEPQKTATRSLLDLLPKEVLFRILELSEAKEPVSVSKGWKNMIDHFYYNCLFKKNSYKGINFYINEMRKNNPKLSFKYIHEHLIDFQLYHGISKCRQQLKDFSEVFNPIFNLENSPDARAFIPLAAKLRAAISESSSLLSELRVLNCEKGTFLFLPFPLEVFNHLKILLLSHNFLTHLPSSIKELSELSTLRAEHNDLLEFPIELLSCKKLKLIDFSFNRLRSIPDEIGRMNQLETLLLNDNAIKHFPSNVKNLRQLRIIVLSNNAIRSIPEEFVELEHLLMFHIDEYHLDEAAKKNLATIKIKIIKNVRAYLEDLKSKLNAPSEKERLLSLYTYFNSYVQPYLKGFPALNLCSEEVSLEAKLISITKAIDCLDQLRYFSSKSE